MVADSGCSRGSGGKNKKGHQLYPVGHQCEESFDIGYWKGTLGTLYNVLSTMSASKRAPMQCFFVFFLNGVDPP